MRSVAGCCGHLCQLCLDVYMTQLSVKIFTALNLPFSEWTTMFPNVRLCKAMVDRLTDQAHIIDTGKESYRLQRTLAKNKGGRQ